MRYCISLLHHILHPLRITRHIPHEMTLLLVVVALHHQWESSQPMSPPLTHHYDRRYPDVQYSSSSRDYPKQSPQLPYYPDRRDDYYPRSISPSHPYPSHEQTQNYSRTSYPSQPDSSYHRVPPPPPPQHHWIQDIGILHHRYQQRRQLPHRGHLDILISLHNHNNAMKQNLQERRCPSVKIDGTSIIIIPNHAIKDVLAIVSFVITCNNEIKDIRSVTSL